MELLDIEASVHRTLTCTRGQLNEIGKYCKKTTRYRVRQGLIPAAERSSRITHHVAPGLLVRDCRTAGVHPVVVASDYPPRVRLISCQSPSKVTPFRAFPSACLSTVSFRFRRIPLLLTSSPSKPACPSRPRTRIKQDEFRNRSPFHNHSLYVPSNVLIPKIWC